MKPQVKAFYIDENTDLSKIEELFIDGWGILPTGNDRLLVLVKNDRKIETLKK